MDEKPYDGTGGKADAKPNGKSYDGSATNGKFEASKSVSEAAGSGFDAELLARYTSAKEYDEGRFWRTVGRHAGKWGGRLLEQILTLYYCMIDPATPSRSKAIIAGAIAYTVLPTDLIPDLIPAVGWTDDAAVITWAGIEVLNSISDVHRSKAREHVARLLGGAKRPKGGGAGKTSAGPGNPAGSEG